MSVNFSGIYEDSDGKQNEVENMRRRGKVVTIDFDAQTAGIEFPEYRYTSEEARAKDAYVCPLSEFETLSKTLFPTVTIA